MPSSQEGAVERTNRAGLKGLPLLIWKPAGGKGEDNIPAPEGAGLTWF